MDVRCNHAFIIEGIGAEKHLATERGLRRVVLDRDEAWENLLADLAGEGLAFGDVLLAEALGAVSEDFVKEDGGGASCEQRGSGVGIRERGLVECFGFL